MTHTTGDFRAPNGEDIDRYILDLIRERNGLYESIDAFNSTQRERARLLAQITNVNKRIYSAERAKRDYEAAKAAVERGELGPEPPAESR